MRGLTYDQLGAAYELRHGFDQPTPWKWIAREYGVTWTSLYSAIKRLERDGMHRDANGEKVLGRATDISDDMLAEVHKARRAGNSWPAIAAAVSMKVGTVQCRYWRWLEANKIPRTILGLSHNEAGE
jgi:hypothetical protein